MILPCKAPDDNPVVNPVPPTNHRVITTVRFDATPPEKLKIASQPLLGQAPSAYNDGRKISVLANFGVSCGKKL